MRRRAPRAPRPPRFAHARARRATRARRRIAPRSACRAARRPARARTRGDRPSPPFLSSWACGGRARAAGLRDDARAECRERRRDGVSSRARALTPRARRTPRRAPRAAPNVCLAAPRARQTAALPRPPPSRDRRRARATSAARTCEVGTVLGAYTFQNYSEYLLNHEIPNHTQFADVADSQVLASIDASERHGAGVSGFNA